MSNRIESYRKAKASARLAGVTGLELRACIDWVIGNESWVVDVELARKSILQIIKSGKTTFEELAKNMSDIVKIDKIKRKNVT